MTCTYTGAYVYFNDYGFASPADLYMVGDAVIIRWNKTGKNFNKDSHPAPARESTHCVNTGPDSFHRDDLGVTVVNYSDFTVGDPIRR